MPRLCSHCSQPGHYCGTCPGTLNDINNYWNTLVHIFIVPKIGSVFSLQDKWMIYGYFVENERWMSSTCNRMTNSISPSSRWARRHLFEYMCRQLEHVSSLSPHMRNQWILQQRGETVEDPDFVEDRTPTPIQVVTSYPIIDATILNLETEEELREPMECVICQEDKPTLNFNTTNCGHTFCHPCIKRHIGSKGKQKPSCPLCRTPITSLETKDVENFRDVIHCFGQTASILKDCMARLGVIGYSPNNEEPFGPYTHHQLMADLSRILHDEFDTDERDRKTLSDVFKQNTDLEKVVALWRYLWTRGIGDDDDDVTYEDFVAGMDNGNGTIVNLPDVPVPELDI